jgi:hypothetical protein
MSGWVGEQEHAGSRTGVDSNLATPPLLSCLLATHLCVDLSCMRSAKSPPFFASWHRPVRGPLGGCRCC